MTVFDRVKELADRKGMSISQVEEKVGMGQNAIYKWKNRRAATDKLILVADLFDVSVDYLLGRDEKQYVEPNLEDFDKVLEGVMSYDGKALTDKDKEAVRIFLQGRLSSK